MTTCDLNIMSKQRNQVASDKNLRPGKPSRYISLDGTTYLQYMDEGDAGCAFL
jgi:hypothetical protein